MSTSLSTPLQRRHFIRLVGGGFVAAATASGLSACSADLPEAATVAWNEPTAETSDVRRWIISYALLAPHPHNLQSWLVDLRQPGEITLYCDLHRLLPETDPFARQIMLGQGTFLELLDMAAGQRGLRADIELFPQGEFDAYKPDQRPTARIRLMPDASVQPDPLFAQVLHRRTNREAYGSREPSSDAIQKIAASVAGQPVKPGFATGAQPSAVAQHRAIATEAWRIELETPRALMESYHVLRVGPSEISQYRDGLTVNSPMVRAAVALGLFDRSKAPAPGDSIIAGQIKDFNAKLATTPAFFWLVTEGNTRKMQVHAGRAYVRAQLAATAQGLSMHPLSQALQEYPEQAKTYADIHALLQAPQPTHTVQMWVRLGYAPAIGPSPRRGLEAHILKA